MVMGAAVGVTAVVMVVAAAVVAAVVGVVDEVGDRGRLAKIMMCAGCVRLPKHVAKPRFSAAIQGAPRPPDGWRAGTKLGLLFRAPTV